METFRQTDLEVFSLPDFGHGGVAMGIQSGADRLPLRVQYSRLGSYVNTGCH